MVPKALDPDKVVGLGPSLEGLAAPISNHSSLLQDVKENISLNGGSLKQLLPVSSYV